MMKGESKREIDIGDYLPHQEGSVGSYLARPPIDPISKRVSLSLMVIGLMLVLVSHLPHLAPGPLDELLVFTPALFTVGIVMVGAGIACIILGKVIDLPAVDHVDIASKAILSAMIGIPKTGVTRRTMMKDVRLRHRYLAGTQLKAFEIWSRTTRLTLNDFIGISPDSLGVFDYDVLDNGRIRLYADESTAVSVRERMYRRGGKEDARHR